MKNSEQRSHLAQKSIHIPHFSSVRIPFCHHHPAHFVMSPSLQIHCPAGRLHCGSLLPESASETLLIHPSQFVLAVSLDFHVRCGIGHTSEAVSVTHLVIVQESLV